jgi:hypothetical protein
MDVFACGPVQEIIEFDWKTTWRNALSTTPKAEDREAREPGT